MNGNINRHIIYYVQILIPVAIIFSAIIGGVINYSPVPYWDMWDGYLEFYLSAIDGDFSVWWSQHNEHRILLSRLLFFLDLRYFQGNLIFLILLNYIFVFLSCWFFYKFIVSIDKNNTVNMHKNLVFMLSTFSLLFFWSQKNNLTWAFQSQFFLAQLIPLISFYCIAKYADSKENKYFISSVLFGFVSIGTMANGVIALPLILIYSILFRLGSVRCSIVFFFLIISFGLYFLDYNTPVNHGSVKDGLLNDPLLALRYVIRYIGSPIHFLANGGQLGRALADISGLSYLLICLFLMYKSLKKIQVHRFELGIFLFILYVGGTALGSAGGRMIFGLGQASSSRYTTPSLMIWVSLIILLYVYYQKNVTPHKYKKVSCYVLLIFMACVLLKQFSAFAPASQEIFEKELAVLSIELDVKDQPQVNHVFPSAEWAQSISEKAIAFDIGIFGHEKFKDSRAKLGKRYHENMAVESCVGFLDHVIDLNQNFYRVEGWIYDQNNNKIPDKLDFISNGFVVGFAITGAKRPDVMEAISSDALYSGFKGYISKAYYIDGAIKIHADGGSKCYIQGR